MEFTTVDLSSPMMCDKTPAQMIIPTYVLDEGPDGKRTMQVFITGEVYPAFMYSEIASVMLMLTDADKVNIHIHTGGGYLEAAQELIQAIEQSPARNNVTAIAHGAVMSAGTAIFAACANHEVAPGADFMFHSCRHGDMGKSISIKSQSEAMIKFVNSLLRRMVTIGMLKEEEYKLIVESGQDVYISGARIAKRLGLTESTAADVEDN